MLNIITRTATSMRARWRWWQGRCPVCTRKLNAECPYYMADHPHCFCQGETRCDEQFWNKYENAVAPAVLIPIAVKQQNEINDRQQRDTPPVLTAKDQRSSGRVTLRQTDKADVMRWEDEGGSLSSQPLNPISS